MGLVFVHIRGILFLFWSVSEATALLVSGFSIECLVIVSLLIFVPMRDVDLLMVFFEHGCGLSVCVKPLEHLWGCIFNVYLLRWQGVWATPFVMVQEGFCKWCRWIACCRILAALYTGSVCIWNYQNQVRNNASSDTSEARNLDKMDLLKVRYFNGHWYH
jgi:hypothetical protein